MLRVRSSQLLGRTWIPPHQVKQSVWQRSGPSPTCCTPAVSSPASFTPTRSGRMMGASATWKVPMHSRQLALDLGETPAPAPLLWELLPAEHQLVAVAALARLIAQAAVPEEDQLDAPINDDPVA